MDMYKKWTFVSIAPIYVKEQIENCENYGDVSLFNSGYKMQSNLSNSNLYNSNS